MAYYTMHIVVEGALEEEESYETFEDVEEVAEEWLETAMDEGFQLEIFVTNHDHPYDLDEPCECHQYVTSHKPEWFYYPEGGDE